MAALWNNLEKRKLTGLFGRLDSRHRERRRLNNEWLSIYRLYWLFYAVRYFKHTDT
ncbi:hypothetical protein GCM10023116_40830 [Kistimonas scapharcae]|uniref:Uncharacterized protein n=1 Tax=Kistimonas scapharcae TaxID=1036133 RepID=A0ABP8V8E4_9GAMM